MTTGHSIHYLFDSAAYICEKEWFELYRPSQIFPLYTACEFGVLHLTLEKQKRKYWEDKEESMWPLVSVHLILVDYVNSATGLAGSFLAYTDSLWILSVSIYVNHEQPMIWSNVFMMLGSNGISFLINKGMEAEVTGSILYALINCKWWILIFAICYFYFYDMNRLNFLCRSSLICYFYTGLPFNELTFKFFVGFSYSCWIWEETWTQFFREVGRLLCKEFC